MHSGYCGYVYLFGYGYLWYLKLCMTKKLFNIILLLAFLQGAKAQLYNNEWINYNNTYYKFKVGPFGYDAGGTSIKKGTVRITQTALAAAGLGSTPSEQFQLWRDGSEVPIYISASSTILQPGDFIEFRGEIANGKTDKALYRDSSFQISDYWNLETDSAAYFLTVKPAGNNKRIVDAANNTSFVNIAPEKNFKYTVGRYYKGYINEGDGIFAEQRLYSSSYETGEGFTSRPVRNNNSYLGQGQMPQTFAPLYADKSRPTMCAVFNMVGNGPNERNIKILLNNDSLVQVSMGYFYTQKLAVDNIDVNRIKNDSVTFIIQNLSEIPEDELKVATIELQYPRLFNFGAASDFEFDIAASDTGRYLKIANFSKGSGNAILYDFSNNKRYVADTTAKDTLQFFLPSSKTIYHLALIRSDGIIIKTISSLESKQFIDFSKADNQGNYLIISNPLIYGTGTNNYVQQYANYRSSDSGGSFNVKITDIHELEDQFAYGITMHPLSIKNFLRYARTVFTEPPADVFLIGKGVTYSGYRPTYSTNSLTAKINLVPVFGSPGSDNLLSSEDYDPYPATPIGRLSAVSPEEVGTYLKKIKEYESAQRDTSQTLASKGWMKKIIQLAGANDLSVASSVDSAQARYKTIISDTLFGGDVKTYSKSIDPNAYPKKLQSFTEEYNNGSALLEYFGHSSTTGIDFNLDNPAAYTNKGKYPVFIVNGCLAGNIFDYDVNRLNLRSSFSEKFVLEPELGSIGYLSTTSYGVVRYLDIFTEQFYRSITSSEYGKGFGQVTRDAITNALNATEDIDFYKRMHAEQYTFHGDPALKMNSFSLPDYIIDSSLITVTPGYITVADDSFTVKTVIYNLGRATKDSIHFTLLRKFPDGSTSVAYSNKLPVIKSVDSVLIKLPIVGNRDKGQTTLTANIDNDLQEPELNEQNNAASININISGADLLPVSPYNYAIVQADTVTLAASTAYSFAPLTQYVMELDTTALFNSPIKIAVQKIASGGLVEFNNIPLLLNNTVYYWRVAEDSVDRHWNNFSFIHKSFATTGFEQAHFYQHTQSTFSGLLPDSALRNFKFAPDVSNIFVTQSIYPTSGTEDAQFSISLNGTYITWSACVGSSIIFNLFDPLTFKPILNTTLPYHSGEICDSMRRYNFEYSTQTSSTRKDAMDFLDYHVQNGFYVVARKVYDQGDADWAPTVWTKDTALYGHNNSLYHRLKDQGTPIDSFTFPRTFIFIFKKNGSTLFKPISILSKGLYDRISLSKNITTYDTAGTITSPLFGPGASWHTVHWYGAAENDNNISSLDIIAVDKNGKDSVFFNADTSQHEIDISTVDAVLFPYTMLRLHTQDSITLKPWQLLDWNVEFDPVAEGAIDASEGINIPDTVSFNHNVNIAYDTLQGSVVFKNISTTAFTPLKINLVLYDAYNVAHPYQVPRTNALPAGDTLQVFFSVNIADLPAGTYNLFLEVNPENEQPEQYHFNNFLYKYIIVEREIILPVRLLSFTAKPLNKTVSLNWTITEEQNVSRYIIEFSGDGRSFIGIGNVPTTFFNSPVKTYNFIHTNPVSGKNYYRIKMMDQDSKFSYSPIRMVVFGNSTVTVFPNPFKDRLNITINAERNLPSTVRLYDVAGKQFLEQKFNTSTTLNLSKLAAGMYIVQVNDGLQLLSFKVYKQ